MEIWPNEPQRRLLAVLPAFFDELVARLEERFAMSLRVVRSACPLLLFVKQRNDLPCRSGFDQRKQRYSTPPSRTLLLLSEYDTSKSFGEAVLGDIQWDL